ncbi:hypothetical protein [Georgenia subflava]|uniref:Uncharacterized protein n=1 Tax=Georgenia subflava TaxID=1622177 RepID=A0A6N7EGC7_9MICO|nr:hypothetical protein [Georgenia subflava]MPV36018.1 hypothetical protein [Georgenia subflava]
MNAPARLGLYAAGLVVIFAGSAVVADAVVPEETVEAWTRTVEDPADGNSIDDGGDDSLDSGDHSVDYGDDSVDSGDDSVDEADDSGR